MTNSPETQAPLTETQALQLMVDQFTPYLEEILRDIADQLEPEPDIMSVTREVARS